MAIHSLVCSWESDNGGDLLASESSENVTTNRWLRTDSDRPPIDLLPPFDAEKMIA